MNTKFLLGDTVQTYIEFTAADAYTMNETDMQNIYIPTYGLQNSMLLTCIQTNDMWAKYLTGCLQTWNKKFSPAFQVSNAVHGIIGELGEIYEISNMTFAENTEKLVDELGDAFYYRTIFCMLYGLNPNLRITNNKNLFSLISMLSDVGKKSAYHNKIDSPKVLQRVEESIAILDSLLHGIIRDNNLQIDTVLQYNLHKLSQRHNTGKFNPNYT